MVNRPFSPKQRALSARSVVVKLALPILAEPFAMMVLITILLVSVNSKAAIESVNRMGDTVPGCPIALKHNSKRVLLSALVVPVAGPFQDNVTLFVPLKLKLATGSSPGKLILRAPIH